jgi:hypothetical protein
VARYELLSRDWSGRTEEINRTSACCLTSKYTHSCQYKLNGPYTQTFTPSSSKLYLRRSQWPRGLRRRSAAERLLGSWVQILRGAWMFVSCTVFVLSSRGLCDGPIPRPEESYRCWCVFECDQVKIKPLHTCCEQVGTGWCMIRCRGRCCMIFVVSTNITFY